MSTGRREEADAAPLAPAGDRRGAGRVRDGALLVASTGGHLAQLTRLAPRLTGMARNPAWATFDGPQSRSLLAGRDVDFVPYTKPRRPLRVLANVPHAFRIIRRRRPRVVVSTGSAIALTFLPLARLMGVRCIYVESAARVQGPSVTGRLLARVPGIELFTQHRGWADARWQYAASIFDDFVSVAGRRQEVEPPTVLVTLGTISYPFRALVEQLRDVLPADWRVTWQTGGTDCSGLDIDATPTLSAEEMESRIRRSDLVISHAGIGSALAALEAGTQPVLVPRRASRGEHVDDHQQQIGAELHARGLAVVREVGALDLEALREAMAHDIERQAVAPRLELR